MLKVYTPYDNTIIKELTMSTQKDAFEVLAKGYALFENKATWLPPHRRIEILERAANIMKKEVETLTVQAASEGGKPYADSKVEVLRAISGIKTAAQHISQLKGEEIPMGLTPSSINRLGFTTREPIGLVLSISAFNHPLNLAVHQVVTAIAAGCPVVIKPSLITPLSCLSLARILNEAGLPDGWCQVVLCDNDVAQAMVEDSRVNYFSFIGSSKVGWYLRSKLAPGTRCALEHGGVAPVIVESDADFEEMIPALAKGAFYHAGQVCVSVQKIFAHKDVVNKVVEEMTAIAQKLIIGDPVDPATEVGPLISVKEVDRVDKWVNQAVKAGAELKCGGKKLSDTTYAPTVLLNPPQDALVSTEEIFGPVVCIYSYENRDEAINEANSLSVHFQAAVFTKNIDVAFECVKGLNAAAVMVNDHTAFRVDWMPFGGRDSSGIGMGGIPYSMEEMTRTKLMVFNSKSL
jgi:acyl-CoA reductase-like NAD-dependent aldehyde dehydrogenase